jgi:hypothetical protein
MTNSGDRTRRHCDGELPAVKTTIVGGRPPGSGKLIGDIPRGIEVLVKKASVDSAFKATLLAQRSRAAGEIGLALDGSEAAMLDLVPASQLETIIDATRVEPSKKAAFLGKAAAVMLVALGATTTATKAQVNTGVREAPPATAPAEPPQPIPAPVAGTMPNPIPRPPASQPTTTSQPATASQPAAQANPPVVQPRPIAVVQIGVRVAGIVAGPIDQPADPLAPASMPTTWPAVPAEKVEALLPQLDSDDFKQREAAQKTLTDLGPGIIPVIQDLLAKRKDLSMEVQARLQRAVRAYQPATQPARPRDVIMVNGIRAVKPGN